MVERTGNATANNVSRRQVLITGASAAAMVGVGEARAAGAFSDMVVLITGATSGLGRASAKAFAAQGAKVYFCGLGEAAGKALVKEIGKDGGVATYVPADVRVDKDIERLFATVADREGRLNIAMNNAAILGIHETAGSYSVENDVMATNAFGVYRSMHHEIPLIERSGGGVIVNTGATSVRNPPAGQTAVVASKAAGPCDDGWSGGRTQTAKYSVRRSPAGQDARRHVGSGIAAGRSVAGRLSRSTEVRRGRPRCPVACVRQCGNNPRAVDGSRYDCPGQANCDDPRPLPASRTELRPDAVLHGRGGPIRELPQSQF